MHNSKVVVNLFFFVLKRRKIPFCNGFPDSWLRLRLPRGYPEKLRGKRPESERWSRAQVGTKLLVGLLGHGRNLSKAGSTSFNTSTDEALALRDFAIVRFRLCFCDDCNTFELVSSKSIRPPSLGVPFFRSLD